MRKLALFFIGLFVISIAFVSCKDDEVTTPPDANAGESQVVYEGEEVTLDASASTDVDSNTLTYFWTAPEGITLSSDIDAQPTFVAPDVEEDTEFTFILSVNDGGTSTEATVDVTVLQSDVAYVINYGSYGNGGASITRLNLETEGISNKFYQSQNSDLNLELVSNIQYAYQYNGNYYLMANSSDGIIVVNDQFVQTVDGISDQIVKPRACVAEGNYLYVSCWGGNIWEDETTSYIAKFNLTSNTVESTISLPGGPEGLAIANGNLYAALNYKDSVAVVSLANESVSYIQTPAVTSYFVKDADDNLYVSLVSTYSDPSFDPGIGYINTSTNTLEETFYLDGVSSGYSSIIAADSDLSAIYVLASSWVEVDGNWEQQGAAFKFDTATGTFSEFVGNLSGINGIAVNPENEKVYIFGGTSSTEPGSVSIYSAQGTLESTFTCGVSPYWISFLER